MMFDNINVKYNLYVVVAALCKKKIVVIFLLRTEKLNIWGTCFGVFFWTTCTFIVVFFTRSISENLQTWFKIFVIVIYKQNEIYYVSVRCLNFFSCGRNLKIELFLQLETHLYILHQLQHRFTAQSCWSLKFASIQSCQRYRVPEWTC